MQKDTTFTTQQTMFVTHTAAHRYRQDILGISIRFTPIGALVEISMDSVIKPMCEEPEIEAANVMTFNKIMTISGEKETCLNTAINRVIEEVESAVELLCNEPNHEAYEWRHRIDALIREAVKTHQEYVQQQRDRAASTILGSISDLMEQDVN